MAGHDIIVIGASAGGVEALRILVSFLPEDLDASVFIVLHVPAHIPSALPEILNRAGKLPVVHAEDQQTFQNRRIYVAPADHHLLLDPGRIRLTRGARQNRHRPAVDPLFRSAAYAYGSRVVGVILTGALDDGTAGLRDIKQRGGIAVVQDPREALYYGMPYSAIEHVAVDYVLPLNDIGPVLAQLATEAPQPAERYPVAQRLEVESQMADREDAEMSDVEIIGIRSAFTCPECHGALWEVKDNELLRFRCHVGHSFSSESLEVEQVEGIEQALWSALRALEEKAELARRILNRLRERQFERAAALQEQKAYEAEQHASTIRAMLLGSPTADSVIDT